MAHPDRRRAENIAGDFYVDDTCIDCPVCANVCPTDAITRDLQPDGGVKLLLNLGA